MSPSLVDYNSFSNDDILRGLNDMKPLKFQALSWPLVDGLVSSSGLIITPNGVSQLQRPEKRS